MKVWLPVIRANSGTDIFTIRFANALRKRGVDASISWFSGRYEPLPHLLKAHGRSTRADVVHANSWNGFAFKANNAPLVVTEHLCVFDPAYDHYKTLAQRFYHDTFVRRYEQRSFEYADRVTAVSTYTAKATERAFGAKPQTIYNWIDTSKFLPRASNHATRKFRILFVGNICRRKGGDLLAPISKKLGDRFELWFTNGLRHANKVELTPGMKPLGRLNQSEIVRAYQECDVLLFPTRLEGFGYAALEAMACGKPVVASDNSSLPEIVVHGETGFLCPTDDVDAFANACRNLAENPTLCREFGEAGRERAESVFSESRIIEQYTELYRELVE